MASAEAESREIRLSKSRERLRIRRGHVSYIEKENRVLTFFDYLRQRAFESVLLGVQQAMDALEQQHVFETRNSQQGSRGPTWDDLQQAARHQAGKRNGLSPDGNKEASRQDNSKEPSGIAADEKLPEPRVRQTIRRGSSS